MTAQSLTGSVDCDGRRGLRVRGPEAIVRVVRVRVRRVLRVLVCGRGGGSRVCDVQHGHVCGKQQAWQQQGKGTESTSHTRTHLLIFLTSPLL